MIGTQPYIDRCWAHTYPVWLAREPEEAYERFAVKRRLLDQASLLFLYQHVLGREPCWLEGIV
jgi:hypothetical protein